MIKSEILKGKALIKILKSFVRFLGDGITVSEALGVSPYQVEEWLRSNKGPGYASSSDFAVHHKIMELKEILDWAKRSFKKEYIYEWFWNQIPALGNARPIDLICTGNSRLVLELLQRAAYGLPS